MWRDETTKNTLPLIDRAILGEIKNDHIETKWRSQKLQTRGVGSDRV